MRTSILWRAALCLSVTALVATACGDGDGGGGGGDGDGGGGEALNLGYVLPETGQLAYLGPPQIQAAKFAIRNINQAGGVLGQDIPEITGSDEGGQEAVAVQSADRVLSAGVDAIIGAAASGMSLAFIDNVTGSGVVQCSGSNTAPTFTDYEDGGFYFRTAPSDALQGPVLSKVIREDGHNRVALVARADDYGRGLMQSTQRALESAGGQAVLTETYDPEATNFQQLVQQIRNSNPDAVAVIAFEEGTQILQAMIEAGVGPRQVGVYGADGLRSEELPTLVSPNDPAVLNGMKGTAPASAENQQFVSQLREFAPDLRELQFAPQVYDCVNIIALAAQQANSTDPASFAPEINGVTKDGEKCTSFQQCKRLIEQGSNIDYDGVSGPLDFIEQGEPGQATIEVYTYDQSGKLQTVRTEVSTGEG
ncbi:branched-chain amino acid ABC transporter substrate-binding protein [Prauserella sp. PE36]|uniref:Amino acid ABC transporter substrate-binding protein n=1 Tax=Prauserella endophytica TaxID=1592324 RepID=A0ABY2RZG2_9PSEU|nr:branched-chain amino acid ABC transporter substrate-binding protein [Prauserella coralliicola]RBM15564.1 branched-chain amino acid ABC transporter substrate-binding protein [Prauserella sp. PE36]TKG66315.1 amino acid ABC transporter substrate-binding protein [Prauserella endophytica]